LPFSLQLSLSLSLSSRLSFSVFFTPPLDPLFSFSIVLLFSTVIHCGYFRARKIPSGLTKNFQTPNLISIESLILASIDQNGPKWTEISSKVE